METKNVVLLVSQRRDRIDAGGAAGGQVAGEEGDDDEAERDGDEGDDVVRSDAEEDGAEEAGEEEGGDQASEDTSSGELEGTGEDELKNVRARGAEGKADADLFVTLRDQISDDAVDAKAGEGECKDREDADEPGAEARLGDGIVDERFHGVDPYDKRGIEGVNGGTHG